jgi:hypothetical protein
MNSAPTTPARDGSCAEPTTRARPSDCPATRRHGGEPPESNTDGARARHCLPEVAARDSPLASKHRSHGAPPVPTQALPQIIHLQRADAWISLTDKFLLQPVQQKRAKRADQPRLSAANVVRLGAGPKLPDDARHRRPARDGSCARLAMRARPPVRPPTHRHYRCNQSGTWTARPHGPRPRTIARLRPTTNPAA